MEALRGRKYQIIAMAAIVAVVAAGVVGTLTDSGGTDLPERYHQHEKAQQLADLPEADRVAASGTNIDAATFASHLPVVSIDTGEQEIPGERVISTEDAAVEAEAADATVAEDEHAGPVTLAADGSTTIPTSFSLFSNDGAANRLSDAAVLSTQAELRIRGHSSRLFDKKSYLVHFTEQDRLTARNLDVLDMGADNEWVLNGPFLDKTMIRNYLSMNIAGEIMPDTPDVRFCELFIDGKYQGVYLLMESVKHDDDRVALTDSDPKSAATSYIVSRDWEDATNATNVYDFLNVIRITRGAPLEVTYPSQRIITEEQFAWIEQDINAFEKALYSYDYDTSSYGYWNFIDVGTFVDYAVINEFTGNIDAGSYSTYFYKDVRGKLSAGPVWDFNNAFNNYMDSDLSDMGFFVNTKPVFYMLYKDEAFVHRVIARYRELREDSLSDERMLTMIDETIDYLGPAIERNYTVWGYSFDARAVHDDEKLFPEERNPGSFDEAVGQLKSYIVERGAWMDRNIENLRQLSHESVNKKYNH